VINTQFITKLISDKIDRKFYVNVGDILIAMTGAEVGKVGIVPKSEKKLWLNQRVGNIEEKIKSARFYIYLILIQDEYQNLLFSSASGSAQPNISASQIENIEIIIPNIELLKYFGKFVDILFDRMLFNQYQIQTLTQIRDSLLPRLMSGKIEISE